MSITRDILKELYTKTHNYKGMQVNILGLPVFKLYKYGSLKSSVHRLKKDGLIDKDTTGWFITKEGRNFFKANRKFTKFNSPFPEKTPRNLIVIFDIPQEKRAERDWLRSQLRRFGYLMIQRSVWVGPSPLPEDFKKYLIEIKIKNDIKTFKLAKGYMFDN
jgi:DNA-binding transcriptional regulator PaaX